MAIIVDLIIVGIIALCTILGYVRGLTKVLLKIISFVLAIVIAFILFKPISLLIVNHTTIDDKIQSVIETQMVGVVEGVSSDIEGSVEESSNMPEAMTEYLQEMVEEGNASGQEAAKEAAKNVAGIIIDAGTWIIVFILARIILIFAKSLLELLVKLPVIKQMDKAGGIIYGLLEGLVIVYLVLAIISFISPMVESASILSAINDSVIGSNIYNNNIILKLIF